MVIDMIDPVKIAPDAEFSVSDKISIGAYTRIGKGFKVKCRSLHIGRHCWIGEGVEIKYGSAMNPWADVTIGDFTGLMDRVLINASRPVAIGKECGLGVETQIWTHSQWLPIMQGFPMQKEEPVTIGDRVWLPSRCQVLPGVTIGSNVVVGIGSVVNRSLPSGCFAAGHPAKIIREQCYPYEPSLNELHAEIMRIITNYRVIAADKGFDPLLYHEYGIEETIVFSFDGERVVFNLDTMEYSPLRISVYAEDFRDHLRRNGLKFYGGGFFESLTPTRFK